ncbi:putative acetyltransferase [Halolamina pelagica]|uniref:Putative acetyltransferase n=1 Tax=Halolamina pelagica TaxID=699431 RepID=A0A0P7HSL1_9EURY|nr:GNAT family N-acetyltransferase [Halolamina pelagica]KPN29663.1 putative acetyltransferase [Halolamina pelagica]
MADVTLREATDDDAAALAATYRDAYAENRRLGFPAKSGSATPEQVARWIRDHRVFVAESEGTVIGGVRLERVDGSERSAAGSQQSATDDAIVTLSRLGVRERWKGDGVGSQLLEHAERAAREAGYTTVRLTTPDEHPFLPEFYHAHGYEITGDYPLAYRDYDEVVMEKSLD